MTLVDIHAHTFNGDDLPVEGFVHRVLLDNLGVLKLVAWVLDKVGQTGTPGYERERAELDRLLGYEAAGLAPSSFVPEPEFEAVVAECFATLETQDPALLVAAERELASEEGEPALPPEAFSPVEGLRRARRAIAWAVLLRRSRLDISRRLVNTYPEVNLFTPMTVDMAIGLKDNPEVSPLQQIELQEKISRLSMLGRLGAESSAKLHPFVGFDPRSQYRSEKVGDVMPVREVVETAIKRFGFVGVKMYPPTGFRPTDNKPTPPDMDAEEASAINSILEDLYKWCEQEDVPIAVHCNASNEARSEYRLFSAPELWAKVLENHDQLRLNLGHFGGARGEDDPSDPATSWPEQIARLAKDHVRLYADTGNHRIDREDLAKAYFEELARLFDGSDTAAMKDRLMYGSDWLMLALVPGAEEFMERYREEFQKYFGPAAMARFMGDAALEFLGFTDPHNKNRLRMIERYQSVGADLPGWLQ